MPVALAGSDPHDPNRYLNVVREFADNVLKYGRDIFGLSTRNKKGLVPSDHARHQRCRRSQNCSGDCRNRGRVWLDMGFGETYTHPSLFIIAPDRGRGVLYLCRDRRGAGQARRADRGGIQKFGFDLR